MTKKPMTPYEQARINEQQALRNYEEEKKRAFEPNPILDDIPFKSCDTAMIHRYEPVALPEMKWRPATPEEIAISGAAHAVTTAGQRGPEQGRFGYFRGMIIITHPDMPPHVWDGKTMARIEPQEG